jgi:hypothetical protein
MNRHGSGVQVSQRSWCTLAAACNGIQMSERSWCMLAAEVYCIRYGSSKEGGAVKALPFLCLCRRQVESKIGLDDTEVNASAPDTSYTADHSTRPLGIQVSVN